MEIYSTAGQATDDNTAQAHCILDTYSYKHNLRICNTSCFSLTFFENRAIYEIPWKYILQQDRPQMTIRRKRIASWIPTATDTLGICNTSCFSTGTTVARTGLYVTLHVYCLSCLLMYAVQESQDPLLV